MTMCCKYFQYIPTRSIINVYRHNQRYRNIMNVNIKGLHIDMTPALSSYIHTKIKNLEKFITSDAYVYIECGRTTEHHKSGNQVYLAEIKLKIQGNTYFARVLGNNTYQNIDTVTHDIIEQVKADKVKNRTLMRRGSALLKKLLRRY